MRLHRRICELRPRTSIWFDPPQREFRMRHVSDPLAAALEIGLSRRHSWKVNGELPRLAVQTDQIKPALLPNHEELLPIRTRRRIAEHERTHRALRRFRAGLAKKRRTLAQRPNVLAVVASRFKQVVIAVRCPGSVKLLRGLVPVGPDQVQTLPVG